MLYADIFILQFGHLGFRQAQDAPQLTTEELIRRPRYLRSLRQLSIQLLLDGTRIDFQLFEKRPRQSIRLPEQGKQQMLWHDFLMLQTGSQRLAFLEPLLHLGSKTFNSHETN